MLRREEEEDLPFVRDLERSGRYSTAFYRRAFDAGYVGMDVVIKECAVRLWRET